MGGRWERQQQFLEILEDSPCSVAEMRDELLSQGDDISTDHINFLLRHYFKFELLNRRKDRSGNRPHRYRYRLSEKGMDQLEWLRERGQMEYIKAYNKKYGIQVVK